MPVKPSQTEPNHLLGPRTEPGPRKWLAGWARTAGTAQWLNNGATWQPRNWCADLCIIGDCVQQQCDSVVSVVPRGPIGRELDAHIAIALQLPSAAWSLFCSQNVGWSVDATDLKLWTRSWKFFVTKELRFVHFICESSFAKKNCGTSLKADIKLHGPTGRCLVFLKSPGPRFSTTLHLH